MSLENETSERTTSPIARQASPDADDFAKLEKFSRLNLRWYRLTPSERLICEVIIDFSFAMGCWTAIMPSLAYFSALTGMDDSDVARTLASLEKKGIVFTELLRREGRGLVKSYAFRPFAPWRKDAPAAFDKARAAEVTEQLSRLNEAGRNVESSGQERLPFDEAECLEAGMTAASREAALKDAAAASAAGAHRQDPALDEKRDGHVRAASLVEEYRREMGEVPIAPEMGKVPIEKTDACALAPVRNVLNGTVQNVLQNVGQNVRGRAEVKTARFRDVEKNLLMDEIDTLMRTEDRRYRPKWIARVRDYADIIRNELGDLRTWLSRNTPKNGPLAVLFKRCEKAARRMGKEFRLF